MPAQRIRALAVGCKTPPRIVHDMPSRVRVVAEAIARAHGFALADLIAHDHHKDICRARFHVWSAMREMRPAQPFSYPQIGRWFGRDHTTILSGVRRASGMLLPMVELPAATGRQALWGWAA